MDSLDTGLCNLIAADFPEEYTASNNRAHSSIKFTGFCLCAINIIGICDIRKMRCTHELVIDTHYI